jgi:hypothetical protein
MEGKRSGNENEEKKLWEKRTRCKKSEAGQQKGGGSVGDLMPFKKISEAASSNLTHSVFLLYSF